MVVIYICSSDYFDNNINGIFGDGLMEPIREIINNIAETRAEWVDSEIIKFIRSLQSSYGYIAYDKLCQVAINDGYVIVISYKNTFLDVDKYVHAIEYTLYAFKLNVCISSRKRTISEQYIVGD